MKWTENDGYQIRIEYLSMRGQRRVLEHQRNLQVGTVSRNMPAMIYWKPAAATGRSPIWLVMGMSHYVWPEWTPWHADKSATQITAITLNKLVMKPRGIDNGRVHHAKFASNKSTAA